MLFNILCRQDRQLEEPLDTEMQIRAAAANLSHQAWEDVRSARSRFLAAKAGTTKSHVAIARKFRDAGYDSFAAMAMGKLVTGGLNIDEFAAPEPSCMLAHAG